MHLVSTDQFSYITQLGLASRQPVDMIGEPEYDGMMGDPLDVVWV